MMWLPTNQASAALFLHRNTLHKYRREGLFKAGTHWIRKGPWRNAGFLYDVDACKETFQQWAVDPPLRLQLINCTRLHRAERDLQGDVVHPNVSSYVINDEHIFRIGLLLAGKIRCPTCRSDDVSSAETTCRFYSNGCSY